MSTKPKPKKKPRDPDAGDLYATFKAIIRIDNLSQENTMPKKQKPKPTPEHLAKFLEAMGDAPTKHEPSQGGPPEARADFAVIDSAELPLQVAKSIRIFLAKKNLCEHAPDEIDGAMALLVASMEKTHDKRIAFLSSLMFFVWGSGESLCFLTSFMQYWLQAHSGEFTEFMGTVARDVAEYDTLIQDASSPLGRKLRQLQDHGRQALEQADKVLKET